MKLDQGPISRTITSEVFFPRHVASMSHGVARIEDIQEGDPNDPVQHPIAIALRRQDDVNDARVTESETLVRRRKRRFRYDPPDKTLFKRLQRDLKTRG